MGRLIRALIRRGGAAGTSLLIVYWSAQALFAVTPGSPLHRYAGRSFSPGDRAALARAWGLDEGVPHRANGGLADLARGRLGASWRDGRPVGSHLRERLPTTLTLTARAATLELLVAFPLAMWAARTRGRAPDRTLRAGAAILHSLPTVAVAITLQHLTPARTGSWAAAVTLAASSIGATTRLLRNAWVDATPAGLVLATRARGVPDWRIWVVHGLRRAAAPVAQALTASLPMFLSGALVVEQVFALPGVGRLLLESARARDLPVAMGVTCVTAAAVILGSWASEGLGRSLDPKTRR